MDAHAHRGRVNLACPPAPFLRLCRTSSTAWKIALVCMDAGVHCFVLPCAPAGLALAACSAAAAQQRAERSSAHPPHPP